jgi:PhoPQ-activated pathogenicity-related protein
MDRGRAAAQTRGMSHRNAKGRLSLPFAASRILTKVLALALATFGAHGQTLGTVVSAPATKAPADVAGALARYIAKPDDTFKWELRTRYRAKGADAIELVLQSQTWQGVAWNHQVVLIKPRGLDEPDHALLIVGGGHWQDSYGDPSSGEEDLPKGGDVFVTLAKILHTVVVVVGQVPYQPLFNLSEDRLIAHTFDEYLRSDDPEWPLLLPMVKTVVRALDASDEASRREWNQPLKTFTIFGASKRGWTTWLTGAVEPRATALVPVVFDALNMSEHFPHQTAVFGGPSEAIKPYTDLGLPDVLTSDRGASLRRIVDPYSYLDALKQPKLIMIATNDAYFPSDSANLYWDALEGPKYLLYLPNEPHSIKHYSQAFRALRALQRSLTGGPPLPKLEWEFVWDGQGSGGQLCVRSDPKPTAVRLWSASSDDRDFRKATWTAGAEIGARDAANVRLDPPATGYRSVVGEVEYGHWLSAYSLTTNLAVLAAPGTPAPGPRPRGVAGVCATHVPEINAAAIEP